METASQYSLLLFELFQGILLSVDVEICSKFVISEKCMYVNSDTIRYNVICITLMQSANLCNRSLCIFDFETHPNMHQKQGKESLSLFGIVNFYCYQYFNY